MTYILSRRRGRHARPRAGHWWGRLVLLAAGMFVVVFVVRTTVADVFYVPSASMEPTLHGCPGCTDDRILVNRLAYEFSGPQRGDVVVFRGTGDWLPPGGGDRTLVKRVIAVAGDTVVCCDPAGRVQLNGQAVTEPYLGSDDHRPFGPVTVTPGHLWVMGDNRSQSADSRDHGLITTDVVIGRAVARVWPLTRWAALPRIPALPAGH